MRKGLKTMSVELSKKLTMEGYAGPEGGGVNREEACDIISGIFNMIMEKMDNDERVLIGDICIIRKVSSKLKPIEIIDIRKE